ncbi:hypothetical protein BC829DRAFT_13464 [Chytridium lagenaria]|nr:hypothetical protein BC829DRAFT_13464 [Chytridium lagenaria]
MTDLPSSTRSFFSDLLPNLSNTVLIYDKPFEQVIKWSCPGGFGAFLDAGVIALRSLETISEKVGKEFGSSASMNNEDVRDAPIFGDDPAEIGTLMNVTSVLFLISTHLARHSDVIRYILHPRPPLPVHPGVPGRPPQRFFKECRIVCSVSEVAHVAGLEMEPDLVAEYEAYLGFERYFGRVESKVKAWMSERGESYPDFEFEEDPVVIVEHLPLVYATISNDLFVIPSDIFPRLYPRDEDSEKFGCSDVF